MICPGCKKEIPAGTKACPHCTAALGTGGSSVSPSMERSFEERLFELDQRFLRGEIAPEEYRSLKGGLEDQLHARLAEEVVEDDDDSESVSLTAGFSWDDEGSDLPEEFEGLEPAEEIEPEPDDVEVSPPAAAPPASDPYATVPAPELKMAPAAPPPPPSSPGIAASMIMRGHKQSIQSIYFSPDGKYLLSGGEGASLKLWSVKSGKIARSLPAGERGFTAVAISPDGKSAFTGDRAQKIIVWDLLLGKSRELGAHDSFVTSLAVAPDGAFVLSGAGDGLLQLWEVESYRRQAVTLQSGLGGINAVGISTDGQHAYAGGDDGKVRMYEIATGELISAFRGHTDKVTSLALAADGRRLVTGSDDLTVRLWKSPIGTEVQAFKGHRDLVLCVAVSADGRWALSGSGRVGGCADSPNPDYSIRLWDLHAGKEACQFTGHDSSVTSVAFSPDGELVGSSSQDKTIRMWKLP